MVYKYVVNVNQVVVSFVFVIIITAILPLSLPAASVMIMIIALNVIHDATPQVNPISYHIHGQVALIMFTSHRHLPPL